MACHFIGVQIRPPSAHPRRVAHQEPTTISPDAQNVGAAISVARASSFGTSDPTSSSPYGAFQKSVLRKKAFNARSCPAAGAPCGRDARTRRRRGSGNSGRSTSALKKKKQSPSAPLFFSACGRSTPRHLQHDTVKTLGGAPATLSRGGGKTNLLEAAGSAADRVRVHLMGDAGEILRGLLLVEELKPGRWHGRGCGRGCGREHMQ